MNVLAIGLYGIYALLVGINGKSGALIDNLKSDAPGFLPWAISIGVLAIANEIPSTQKIVAPFMTLLIIAFVLRNFDTLKSQFAALSSAATTSE